MDEKWSGTGQTVTVNTKESFVYELDSLPTIIADWQPVIGQQIDNFLNFYTTRQRTRIHHFQFDTSFYVLTPICGYLTAEIWVQ